MFLVFGEHQYSFKEPQQRFVTEITFSAKLEHSAQDVDNHSQAGCHAANSWGTEWPDAAGIGLATPLVWLC